MEHGIDYFLFLYEGKGEEGSLKLPQLIGGTIASLMNEEGLFKGLVCNTFFY